MDEMFSVPLTFLGLFFFFFKLKFHINGTYKPQLFHCTM